MVYVSKLYKVMYTRKRELYTIQCIGATILRLHTSLHKYQYFSKYINRISLDRFIISKVSTKYYLCGHCSLI